MPRSEHGTPAVRQPACRLGTWQVHPAHREQARGRSNAARFATSHPNATFLRLDLTRDPLPDADALLCRDCLVHLPYAAILDVFRNIRRSRIRWVILTTFTRRQINTDIEAGDWRPLNLQRPPFCLPPPLEILVEECPEENGAYADKALAVWPSDQLPPA